MLCLERISMMDNLPPTHISPIVSMDPLAVYGLNVKLYRMCRKYEVLGILTVYILRMQLPI